MANLQLKDTEKVPYTIQALDAKGNVTSLNPGETLAVASSDTDSATVVPDATPATGFVGSGFIVAGAKLGTVQINVTESGADGNPDGVTGQLSIDIVAGAEASIAVAAGTPVPQ